jgi:plastocyanin
VDITLAPNGSGAATATLAAGGYDFVCRFHANMTGTLTVS